MISDPQALVGQSLGEYRLDHLLGGGGMGLVYLAHEERDPAHVVAIKVLLPTWQHLATPGRDQLRRRFQQEAELLRQLRHPHILKLLASGEERNLLYMVLPYIAGKTLAERIAAGQLPLEEVARIGGQVAEALAYAHNLGIIHRDIKPSNILLDDQGQVLLADFSIAKLFDLGSTTLTGTGQVLGDTRLHGARTGDGAVGLGAKRPVQPGSAVLRDGDRARAGPGTPGQPLPCPARPATRAPGGGKRGDPARLTRGTRRALSHDGSLRASACCWAERSPEARIWHHTGITPIFDDRLLA